jgi:hypothetical protein
VAACAATSCASCARALSGRSGQGVTCGRMWQCISQWPARVGTHVIAKVLPGTMNSVTAVRARSGAYVVSAFRSPRAVTWKWNPCRCMGCGR